MSKGHPPPMIKRPLSPSFIQSYRKQVCLLPWVEGRMGFEPTTPGATIQRSNQQSYNLHVSIFYTSPSK